MSVIGLVNSAFIDVNTVTADVLVTGRTYTFVGSGCIVTNLVYFIETVQMKIGFWTGISIAFIDVVTVASAIGTSFENEAVELCRIVTITSKRARNIIAISSDFEYIFYIVGSTCVTTIFAVAFVEVSTITTTIAGHAKTIIRTICIVALCTGTCVVAYVAKVVQTCSTDVAFTSWITACIDTFVNITTCIITI